MKQFSAGLVQQACGLDIQENIEKSLNGIREAKKKGASLVALQELHRSLYFCQNEDVSNFELAEEIPGPTTDIFGKIAGELEIVLVTSLFEKRAPGIYHNTAVVFDRDGSIAGKYRKMHIPDDPGFYEKFYFTPGDLSFKPIKTSLGSLGVLICWDQWYPEAARLMALNGAEILIYPTAIGWDPSDNVPEKKRQLDAWVTVQRGHAVANGLNLLSINRTGFEQNPSAKAAEGINFWGNSFACGPQGELLAEAPNEETVLMVEIDPARTESVRRIWPFFRDRRIDSFEGLLGRYGN